MAVTGAVLLIAAATLLVFAARTNISVRVGLRNTAGRLLARPELRLGRSEGYQELVDRIWENTGYRTVIVDPAGQVVVDSGAEDYAALPLIKRIPLDPVQEVFAIQDQDGKEWLYTGRRVASGYALVLMELRQPLRDLLRSPISLELMKALFQSALVALVLSLVLSLLLSQSVAAPLKQISEAVRKLASGKQTRVEPKGPREVRALGEAFNEMSAQVFSSQQSQRDFVANVSHELKTPLTSVQGFAQAILDGTASTPESQQQAAQVIFDEAGRMHRMVLDLLDLARLDAGTADLRRERVELDVLLPAVLERLSPQSAQAEVTLVDQISSLPDVIGDGDRLSQVFNNLVDNAINHTPPGGRVTVSTALEGGEVLVSVQDTGAGIPQEELSRIFERFYQLDKSRKRDPEHGAGLGLAIAHQIIAAHGGRITARSTLGAGSLFQVVLPMARPDDATLTMRKVD